MNSSNLPLEPEDTPIGYLGVELEGWKLCSPENVCMDVVKIKDGADGENEDNCEHDDGKESEEEGISSSQSKNWRCKSGSSKGPGFFFPVFNERKQEQEAYRSFLMNTMWGISIIYHLFLYYHDILLS